MASRVMTFEMRRRRRLRVAAAAFIVSALTLLLTLAPIVGSSVGTDLRLTGDAAAQSSVRPPSSGAEAPGAAGAPPPSSGPVDGNVPGEAQGTTSDSEFWRQVRQGQSFNASTLDPNGAVLVQSDGEAWRSVRNGPLAVWGVYALAGSLAILVLFYLFRGRIRIEAGRSAETIQRFNGLERFGHWLLAGSFIILAITGLNVSYGRYVLLPVTGPELFTQISIAGKWLHNNVAWAFMAGLLLTFLLWVAHNIPSMVDLRWIAKGGGLFRRGVHVDSRKFNAGQKLIFWSTMLLGASLSLSGVALLFPYETAMMGKTFAAVNSVAGTTLPTALTPLQEMQLQTLWHSIVALAMIAIIVAHIYIGSLGMEGAFAAMGSGEVDLNWAKEHHNLWVEEVQSKSRSAATPAE